MPIQVAPSGPALAEIMIVGEAPGAEEERQGIPFVGPSGYELDRMLHEVGIARSLCFVTNVCRERPLNNDIDIFIAQTKKEITKEHIKLRDKWVKPQIVNGVELLKKEISLTKPKMIIALGNVAMWALTGNWGVTKWRGSMIYEDLTGAKIRCIPTYHPAMILRQWEFRAAAIHDLRRAAAHIRSPYPDPGWRFRVRPSYAEVMAALEMLESLARKKAADRRASAEEKKAASEPGKEREEAAKPSFEISFDLETRHGHIACAGLSWTLQDAICIPFMCVERREGYWADWEEAEIVWRLYKLLTHSEVTVVGQNLLYDSQYTFRYWMFVPRTVKDSMIRHHVCYAGLPKRLDFQASMYCEHFVYWKDDGKNWNPKMGEEDLWRYNAEDCVRTQECLSVGAGVIKKMGLEKVDEFQQAMFWPVLKAMQLGVLIDKNVRSQMALELFEEMTKREEWFTAVLGHLLNPRSPKQMHALFYDDLRMPVIRKMGRPTLDEDALVKLGAKQPILKPLIKKITEHRSLGVFLGTFVKAPLDVDDRMRCSYNICGASTYRLSSSKNAFGSGANLQTIPEGTRAVEPEDLELPNIRKMFIPDPGYEFFNLDLDRADLQVVVWESGDENLKKALRMGVDMHCMNAVDIYRIKGIPVEELADTHPNYPERRAQIGETKRQRTKAAVHAVDYACKARTLAETLSCTVHEADEFITNWLAAHPGIKRWHERVDTELRTRRMVRNKYGYVRFFFERVEGLLPEALAWIPQSTVAITVNKIWHAIYHSLPEVQVLLQVHDSLAGQYRLGFDPALLKALSNIVIPYDDPLIIPVSIKTSRVSWGHCK